MKATTSGWVHLEYYSVFSPVLEIIYIIVMV